MTGTPASLTAYLTMLRIYSGILLQFVHPLTLLCKRGMYIAIERYVYAGVAQHLTERFDVHTGLDATSGEGMAQGMIVGARDICGPYDSRKMVLHGTRLCEGGVGGA